LEDSNDTKAWKTFQQLFYALAGGKSGDTIFSSEFFVDSS
jgi:hypothetical protein